MCIWRYTFFVCFVLFCGIHVYRDLKGYQIECIYQVSSVLRQQWNIYISLEYFCNRFFSVFNFNQLPNELMAKSLTFFFVFVCSLCTRFKLNIKLCFLSVFEQILKWKYKECFRGFFLAFCLMLNQWKRNLVEKSFVFMKHNLLTAIFWWWRSTSIEEIDYCNEYYYW